MQQVGELPETEGHHPDVSLGWGYATISLRTKKIEGLHENDFIMAAMIDRFRLHGFGPSERQRFPFLAALATVGFALPDLTLRARSRWKSQHDKEPFPLRSRGLGAQAELKAMLQTIPQNAPSRAGPELAAADSPRGSV